MSKFVTSIFIATISVCCPLVGQTLENQISNLLGAESSEADELIDGIVDDGATWNQISKVIDSGVQPVRSEDRQTKLASGWSLWEATDHNGVSRPYQIYLPEQIASGKKEISAVIVHMHGAVNRPDFNRALGTPASLGYAGILWPKLANQNDFIIACPAGRSDCVWWSDAGVDHVDAVIRDLSRMFKLPHDAIFGAGFSDGASGCYYRAMAKIDPFAGFIAMNGHPAVAATASGKQIYLPNMSMTETIAAMTQEDSLYPSKSLFPHIQVALENGANVLTVSYPNMNHQPSYFDQQTPMLLDFIAKTRRKRLDEIRWYSAEPETSELQWLKILEFDESARTDGDAFNVDSTPGRIRLGILLSPTDPSEIRQAMPGSAAQAAGIKKGDRLVSFDGTPIEDGASLRRLLATKNFGDKFKCKIERDGSEIDIAGEFPNFVPQPVYLRSKPTGFVSCRLTGDGTSCELETMNVAKVRIWLPNSMMSKDTISVICNGENSEHKILQADVREALVRYNETADPVRIQICYVDVETNGKSNSTK